MSHEKEKKAPTGRATFRLGDVIGAASIAAASIPSVAAAAKQTAKAEEDEARARKLRELEAGPGAPITNNAGGNPLDPDGVTSAVR